MRWKMIKYSDIQRLFNAENLAIEEYNVQLNEEQIETPFLVYQATNDDDFGADGVNYIKILNVIILMVDEVLNFPLQRKIESIFVDNGVSYDKRTNFDDEERLYAISYNIEVFDDGVV